MIGGYSVVTQDVLPSPPPSPRESRSSARTATDSSGAAFQTNTIETLQTAFRLLTEPSLNTTQAVERIRAEVPPTAELEELLAVHCIVRARVHQMKYGSIAGNGRFPILALETARSLGHQMVAIGIQEEASRDIEPSAARTHWISSGQLSKLIDILKTGRHHRDHDGRPGEAHEDLLRDPAGLAAREAAVHSAREEYRCA